MAEKIKMTRDKKVGIGRERDRKMKTKTLLMIIQKHTEDSDRQ